MIIPVRPRRNRKSKIIRDMVQETHLNLSNLIFPIFLVDGENKREPVLSMPGISRFSIDEAKREIEECLSLGIKTFVLFPNVDSSKKDSLATYGTQKSCFYLNAISTFKEAFSEICLVSDVAMDPYSSDGHDGVVRNGRIINDDTLEILGKMALVQAEAGIDIIGPSDMMDGRVGYLRDLLDDRGYGEISIMAYTAKYASSFYGPFRDALESAPKFGDKKTYQMNPANVKEALLEARLDAEQGADILMVKPGLAYLDVIAKLSEFSTLPIAAYNVSGEYSMIKAAAERGWIDGEKVMVETLLAFKRAGATCILTYFAKEYAKWVKNS